MAVRNDKVNYMPPSQIVRFEQDLSALMMFLSRSADDGVVAPRPDDALLSYWFEGGSAPRFVSMDEARSDVAAGARLCPWGQSREVLHRFGQGKAAKEWNLRLLLSRRTSVKVEKELRRMAVNALGLGFDACPEVVESASALSDYVAEVEGNVVLKSLWSSSGRGVLISRGGDAEALLQWGRRMIASDGAVVAERKLERQDEMTLLFERNADGSIAYLGRNIYRSADNGRFGKEIVSPERIVEERVLATAVSLLCQSLLTVLAGSKYVGPIGVDAMTYRQGDKLLFRPCTEVNLRHTMGNVGIVVSRHIAEGASAWWHIGQFGSPNGWNTFCAEAQRQSPTERDSDGRIVRGFFRLTGLADNQQFAAFGWAGEKEI